MMTAENDRDEDEREDDAPGSSEGEAPKAPAVAEEPGGEEIELVDDERLAVDGRDGQGAESGDDRLERRRKERRERKEKRKAYAQQESIMLQAVLAENAALKQRVDGVEGQQRQAGVSAAENARNEWVRYRHQLVEARAKALEDGNGKAFSDYDAKLREAEYNANYYADVVNRAKAQPQPQAAGQSAAPQVDQTVVSNARTFVARHSWYNPAGTDERSVAVKELDAQVMREGFDPRTAQYWEELERRVKQRLDDDDDGDDEAPPRRREPAQRRSESRGAPPVGGRSDARRPSDGGNTVYVPPALKQAMQEAGQWDDPKVRNRVLRDYQARQSAARR